MAASQATWLYSNRSTRSKVQHTDIEHKTFILVLEQNRIVWVVHSINYIGDVLLTVKSLCQAPIVAFGPWYYDAFFEHNQVAFDEIYLSS